MVALWSIGCETNTASTSQRCLLAVRSHDICRRSIREGESNRATRQHRAVACWSWSRLVEYGSMIKNPETYRRQSEAERFEALRQMSAEESIALGEALLCSEIMRLAEFPDDDHARSLAIGLGIKPHAAFK